MTRARLACATWLRLACSWPGGRPSTATSRIAPTLLLLALASCLPVAEPGTCAVAQAFREGASNQIVECDAVVTRTLADDNDGSRHQRFIVRMSDGQTLLVSHNIDLAPRVEGLRAGDAVRFRGEYEWNDRGGVIHWTHHDPAGRHEDGWIEHGGERYR